MDDGIHNLDIHDTEVLAEWSMYHLSMEQRIELMAEMPLIYAKLYPSVSQYQIAHRVMEKIAANR